MTGFVSVISNTLIPTPALLVEPSLSDVLLLVPILSSLGYQVTAADSFQEAKQLLLTPPKLLITDIRLGEFNGLQLVLRAKSVNPTTATVVTSQFEDPVLQAEAENMGATFVKTPTSAAELRAAISRTALQRTGAPPQPIRAPFERRVTERREGRLAGPFDVERRAGDRRTDPRTRIRQLTPN